MPATLQMTDYPYVFPLDADPFVIGGRDGAVRVPGTTKTRRHARVFLRDDFYWVEDLGGDGVLVNDVQVELQQLRHRDRIRVGALELDFFAS